MTDRLWLSNGWRGGKGALGNQKYSVAQFRSGFSFSICALEVSLPEVAGFAWPTDRRRKWGLAIVYGV